MPLFWISLCLVAGMLLAELLPVEPATLRVGWLVGAGLSAALLPLLRRLPEYRRGPLLRWLITPRARLRLPPLLLLACLCLGAARLAWHAPAASPNHIAHWNDAGPARMLGVVAGDVDRRDRSTMLRVKIEYAGATEDSGLPQRPVRGMALVLLPAQADVEYGDRLLITGAPVTPPADEDFSYRDYLAHQGIYTYITYPKIRRLQQDAGNPLLAAIYTLRQNAQAQIYQLFPAPEAPLLSGILLGLDNDLPPDLTRAFQDTGTAHIIAISGFNIAVLAGLFASLFGRLVSRWWALALSILSISLYTLLVGATPSVVRAAIMGSLALLAQQVGRKSAGLHTLVLTAAAMCLGNPLLPWDASFQLSFAATLGLILYGNRLQAGFLRLLQRRMAPERARRVAGPVGEYLLMTLAAQAVTLPIILYHFQRLSLSAILANPLVLPPQPLVMVLSGLAVLTSFVSQPLAQLLAGLAWPLSAYTIRMVELLARLKGGAVSLDSFDLGTLVILYALVFSPLAIGRYPRLLHAVIRPGVLLGISGLAAALLWRGAQTAPDGLLHLTVLDFDGAQAVLVQAPGGESLLVNSGPSARLLRDALGRRMSPFDRRLDVLLINAPSASGFSGFAGLVEQSPPRQVLWGSAIPTTRSADRLAEALEGQAVPTQRLAAEQTLHLGEVEVRVALYNPQGSALWITWRGFRALLPGANTPAQLSSIGHIHPNLLILDPRNLQENDCAAWLALNPQAIITTGSAGPLLLAPNEARTRSGGWVSATSDGTRMWLEQAAGPNP